MKKCFITIIILLGASLILWGCTKKGEVLGEEAEAKKQVEVQEIRRQDEVTLTLTASGIVIPKDYAVVSSLTQGIVEFLSPVGSVALRGKPLFTIRDASIENNYFNTLQNFQQTQIVTQQRVTQAELSVNSAKARLELARANLENTKEQAEQNLLLVRRFAFITYNSAYNVLSQTMNTFSVGPASNRIFIYSGIRTYQTQHKIDTESFFDQVVNAFVKLGPLAQEEHLEQNADLMYDNLITMKTMTDMVVLLLQNASPNDSFTAVKIESDRVIIAGYQNQINQFASNIVNARNNLATTKINTDLLIKQAKNQLDLSEIEYNNTKIGFESAKSSSQLEQNLAQSRLDNASYNFGNLALPSPFTGAILSHFTHIGEQVRPGQNMVEIGNLSRVEIELEIDEEFVKGLHINDEVVIDKEHVGIITEIEPAGDLESGKVGVTAQADNTEGQLEAGSVVIVKFTLAFPEPDVIVIPIKTVTIDAAGNFLFVVKDGVAEKREVILGKVFGDKVSVVSGLEEGDMLIVSTDVFVHEGEEVTNAP